MKRRDFISNLAGGATALLAAPAIAASSIACPPLPLPPAPPPEPQPPSDCFELVASIRLPEPQPFKQTLALLPRTWHDPVSDVYEALYRPIQATLFEKGGWKNITHADIAFLLGAPVLAFSRPVHEITRVIGAAPHKWFGMSHYFKSEHYAVNRDYSTNDYVDNLFTRFLVDALMHEVNSKINHGKPYAKCYAFGTWEMKCVSAPHWDCQYFGMTTFPVDEAQVTDTLLAGANALYPEDDAAVTVYYPHTEWVKQQNEATLSEKRREFFELNDPTGEE